MLLVIFWTINGYCVVLYNLIEENIDLGHILRYSGNMSIVVLYWTWLWSDKCVWSNLPSIPMINISSDRFIITITWWKLIHVNHIELKYVIIKPNPQCYSLLPLVSMRLEYVWICMLRKHPSKFFTIKADWGKCSFVNYFSYWIHCCKKIYL